jgi:hypothetical protein
MLPVKFQVQGQYMPVHPDVFGQKWNLQFRDHTGDPQARKRKSTGRLEGWITPTPHNKTRKVG